jgi:hypothetical protein
MIKYWNTLSIPEWAVCAIEYGDFSDLSDEEKSLISGFFEDFPLSRFTIQWGNNLYFSNNPAFGLPSTCIDAEIYEHGTETA